jgi:3-keto-5-aminohexanoate cleavage enzyme
MTGLKGEKSMSKTIITVALTGAWPQKSQNPNVPMSPKEIAEDVYACYRAGAAIAHLHMRDENGRGAMDAALFEDTAARIREKCDILINCTTSGDLNATDDARQKHLRSVRPHLASYDCGSMNWMNDSVFLNPPAFLEELGKTMQECGVKPEIEIFDAGMIYNSLYYLKKGVLKAPLHYQFVLGAAGGTAATVENLVYLKGLIPEGSTWSALGIGRNHIPILLAALALGGHVRVGLEDNLYFGAGVLATNAGLVERAASIIRCAGGEPATPEEAKKLLSIV